jgi:hypothetical protein
MRRKEAVKDKAKEGGVGGGWGGGRVGWGEGGVGGGWCGGAYEASCCQKSKRLLCFHLGAVEETVDGAL